MGEQVAAGFPWGISSVGRAPALQAGGHEFDSRILHWLINISQVSYIAPQELCSFGRVQARYKTKYFQADRCKHPLQKIFVLQCTLKTAYKKYLNDNCSADHLDYDQRSSSRCGWAPNTDFIKCLNTSKLVQTHDSSVLGWTVNQIKTSEVNVIYRHLTEIRENE